MAICFLLPDPVQSTFFIPGGNVPGNGVQVGFFVAGSSTPTTVYKDNAANVAWSNPIVLDSGGNIPLGGEVWVPTGVIVKVTWAPSNDTFPPLSPYRTMDNLSGINDVSATSSEWNTGPTPTFISGTTFTLSGDQTQTFQINRRIKTTNTGGTIYSRISNSVFSLGVTTLTVVNDSGSLDAGLSAVFYGILSATNPSIPTISDINPIVSGSVDRTKTLRFEVDGLTTSTQAVATIPNYSFVVGAQATASTLTASSVLNVSTATGTFGLIQGTTAISQFTMFDGQMFSGFFTTTTPLNNSTTLPLPGGVNMTSVAGDIISLRGTSTNAVVVESFQSVNGLRASQGASEVLLQALTLNNTSLAVLNVGIDSTYDRYHIVGNNIVPVSSNTKLVSQLSNNLGTSWVSSATSYQLAIKGFGSNGASSDAGTTAIQAMFMTPNGIGNSFLQGGVSFDAYLVMPSNTTQAKSFYFDGSQVNINNTWATISGMGVGVDNVLVTSAVNAISFVMQSLNISTGTLQIYGVKKNYP